MGDSAIFEDRKNFFPITDIIISLQTREELNKVEEKQRLLFLRHAQDHYINGCKYLMQRIGNSAKLMAAFACLHPLNKKLSKSCKQIITVARALPLTIAEDVLLDEWKVLQLDNEEADIEMEHIHIDKYWGKVLSKANAFGETKYPSIFAVVTAALTLSHGNADIERGFSTSKLMLTENRACMSERTLNALLNVKDAMKQYNNSPYIVPITKKLISAAQNAHRQYQLYVEREKERKQKEAKEKEEQQRMKKEEEEKIKQVEKLHKGIEHIEVKLSEKKKNYASSKETVDSLFEEASNRLKNAIAKNDLKEARVAQVMLEAVQSEINKEKQQQKEIENLQKVVDKRKACLITNFFSKKQKTKN